MIYTAGGAKIQMRPLKVCLLCELLLITDY